jgi:hypothetical protein
VSAYYGAEIARGKYGRKKREKQEVKKKKTEKEKLTKKKGKQKPQNNPIS